MRGNTQRYVNTLCTHTLYIKHGVQLNILTKFQGLYGGSNKRNFEQKTCDLKHSLYNQIGVVSVTLWSHLEPHSKQPCGNRRGSGSYKSSSAWNCPQHARDLARVRQIMARCGHVRIKAAASTSKKSCVLIEINSVKIAHFVKQ